MRNVIFSVVVALCPIASSSQSWTARQCMQYAVEHNHDVKRAELELDNYKAQQTGAVGRFLPAVDAAVGVQYNFGRAINPETNGYTDVSTFYNGYSLQASLPVFDGFSRLHALRAAKAGVLMGQSALRQRQNLAALNVLQAFAHVAYYEGLVGMARQKVAETELLLSQSRLMEEVGRKSSADVAQVESQRAEADYELLRQQNLHASALLELKKEMAFPLNDTLAITVFASDTLCICPEYTPYMRQIQTVYASDTNAELQASYYDMLSRRHEWYQARAAFFPTLSFSAGLNTTYYHTLHSHTAEAFGSQFRNNMGQYVAATLSIPLFNRLQTITSVRKAKNNYRIAQEAYAQKQLELAKLCREAFQDWQGYLKQAEQMEKKVEADSIAYQLTRRQYEEGLTTAIELRTTSSELLNSKATLLQCRLMAMVKEHLIRYYRGATIWE